MTRYALMFKWIVTLCLALNTLEGVFEPVFFGGVHEAFISRDSGPAVFSSIATVPPQPIEEHPPEVGYPHAVWMKGYWAWSPINKDYIWVTGAWRVPPPGMTWVPGEWAHFDEVGWAWLNGFWSQQPLDKLAYINTSPADPVEEKPGFPDSSNYFWNPGNWSYSESEKRYEWISGNWELLDANWILVPAHYEWRSGGYLYIPAYWDWPIDRRGLAYMPVLIPKAGRTDEFFPMERFEEQQIYNTLISYYPNYLYVCHHIYHFHPERWATIAPTWWQWHSWWSLPWHNQWGLWWWYTHSGYPIPAGLTQDIAERIRSANPRLLQLVSDEQPPFVITSKGAVSPDAILTTLYKGKPPSKQVPILPSNPKILEKLQEEAEKEIKRPERIQETLNEVEPSKRGKLYGIREAAVRQSDYDATLKPDVPRVKLPRKPILTPGEPQKATVNHDEVEPEKQRTKAKAPNPEVELVPVKDLKEAKGKVEAEKTARPKHIPPPDATIIQQVLPGPRVGPPIEFDENKNVVPPPHKTDLQPTPEEKSTVPNLRA